MKNILPRSPQTHISFEPPPPLDQRDWQFLFINSRTMNFTENETVIHHGDKNTDLWLIQAGSVRVCDGITEIAKLSAGEFFGDISFISQLPAQCEIVAEEDCIIQRMPSNFVLRVLECGMLLFLVCYSYTHTYFLIDKIITFLNVFIL